MPAKIIILGKPNVGKSSLFNVIMKKNIAIVDNLPGLTRDLRRKKIKLWDKECEFIDSPGLGKASNLIEQNIRDSTLDCSKSCDLIVVVFDGKSDLTYDDLEIISLSRKFNKPILSVVNKTEGKFSQDILDTLNKKGLRNPLLISATHNQSIDQFKWKIYEFIKDFDFPEKENVDTDNITVAIVGKTNTGKSTIFNLINRKKIALTGAEPNLTRDSIESNLKIQSINFRIFDTAGFSKNNREKINKLSIDQTLKKIRLCKFIIIVFDVNNYFEKINSKIVSLVYSENRCHILVVNKMDTIKDIEKKELVKHIQELNPQIRGAPILFVSAKEKYGFENLNLVINKQLESWNKRIRTSELNNWLANIMVTNPPPLKNGKTVKLKYASQVSISPPKFNIFSNYPSSLNNQYKRFISNKLKQSFSLDGIPIKILFKKTTNPYENN